MGTKGREVIAMDVDELIEALNKAFADEWLAYVQYWIGAKIAVGPMRATVAAELLEHATEELAHADLVAERIIQLGGTPLLKPEDWFKATNCGYETPDDPGVEALLAQNIDAERCAIRVYKEIMDLTKDTDPITYQLALQIFTDEVTHEEDLEAIMEDIERMKAG